MGKREHPKPPGSPGIADHCCDTAKGDTMKTDYNTTRRDRAPPGFERVIWQRVPAILFYGTLLPVLVALTWRWSAPEPIDRELENALLLMDFTMIGVVALHWTLVLTLALACRIVMIMKGPAQCADPYPLPDRETPAPAIARETRRRDTET